MPKLPDFSAFALETDIQSAAAPAAPDLPDFSSFAIETPAAPAATPKPPMPKPMRLAPPGLTGAQIRQESGGNPFAVSPAGATGLMQVMPDTARDPGFGVEPFDPSKPLTDPEENVRFGTRYMDAMLRRYNGDLDAALAAYNAGPGRADAWVRSGKTAALPAETTDYITKVKGWMSRGAQPVTEQVSQDNAEPDLVQEIFSLPPSERRPFLEKRIHEMLGIPFDLRAPAGTLGAGEAPDFSEEAKPSSLPKRNPKRTSEAPDFSDFSAQAIQPVTDGEASPWALPQGFMGALMGTNPKMFGDAAEGFGVLLDNQTLLDTGKEWSQYGEKELEGYKARVPSIADIRTDNVSDFLADLGAYAGYQTGAGLGTSAPSLVMGGAAALATVNPYVGLAVGAAAPSYIQNFGDVYGSARDDEAIAAKIKKGELTQKQVAGTAAVAAIPIAALDVAGLETILGKAVFNNAKKDLVRRIVKGIATGSLAEGSTEGLQEVVSQWAQTHLGSETSAYEKFISVADNFFGGVFPGGLFGGVGGAAARTSQRRRKARQSGEETPPAGPTPQEPEQQPAAAAEAAPAPAPGTPEAIVKEIDRVVAAPTDATEAERETLRAMGYSDQDIADMAPAERAAELEQARAQGAEPRAADQPTAEPYEDLLAQAGDLKAKDSPRQAVWLPKASVDEISKDPKRLRAITSKGSAVRNFDGQGGILVARTRGVANKAVKARDAGQDLQEIIGELTGAGRGKPAAGTAVVQQVDADGNVTRESLVTGDQLEQTKADFAAEGRQVRVVAPEEVLARRAEGAETLPQAPSRAPEASKPGQEAPSRAEQGALDFSTEARAPASREAPLKVESAEDVALAGERVAEPTESQAAAGNYRHGHIDVHGLKISVETPKGGIRRGKGPDGKPWEVEMPAAYGYVKRTEGADGDQVDVFVGDDLETRRAFVIDQVDATNGRFDEHKIVLGVRSQQAAKDLYARSFSDGKGPDRIGSVTGMTVDQLKEWLAKPQTKAVAKAGKAERAPIAEMTERGKEELPGIVKDVQLKIDEQREGGVPAEATGEEIKPDVEPAKEPAKVKGNLLNRVKAFVDSEAAEHGAVGRWKELVRKEGMARVLKALDKIAGDSPLEYDRALTIRNLARTVEEVSKDKRRGDVEAIKGRAKAKVEARAEAQKHYQEEIDAAGALMERMNARAAELIEEAIAAVPGLKNGTPIVANFGVIDPRTQARLKEVAGRFSYRKGDSSATLLTVHGGDWVGLGPDDIRNHLTITDEADLKRRRETPSFDFVWGGEESFTPEEMADLLNDLSGGDRKLFVVPAGGGQVAISVDDPDNLVAISSGSGFHSRDEAVRAFLAAAAEEAGLDASDALELERAVLEGEAVVEAEGVEEPEEEKVTVSGPDEAEPPPTPAATEKKPKARETGPSESEAAAKEPRRLTREREIAATVNPDMPAGYELVHDGKKWVLRSPDGRDLRSTARLDRGRAAKLLQLARRRVESPSDLVPESERQAAAAARSPKPEAKDTFDAAFDAALDEVYGREKPDTRSTAEVAKSAAKNVAEGADAAMAGLVKLFGGGERIASGLAFDEKTYAQARPLFIQAAAKFGDAKGDVNELVRRMVAEMRRLHGLTREGMEQMRPYLRRFVDEVEEGTVTLGEPAPAEAASMPLDLLRDRLLGDGFKTIIEARRFAKDSGIKATGKALDELIEQAAVLAARQIVAEGKSQRATYDALVALHDRLPNLGTRTSTSVANQAYSTPLPLAYMASRLGGVAEAKTVYEPTAGNGALLIEADPARQTVRANEIDPSRADALEAQGFDVTRIDAAASRLKDSADAVIMNPPFGATREGGQSKVFKVGDWTTTQLDHAIALRSLEAMKDGGRAVLLVGGVRADSIEDLRKGYRAKAKREFYARLYRAHNVVDHFTVAGELYRKQGAGWPVDVVVIDGRGKSTRPLPAAEPPPIFTSWDALAEKLHAESLPRPARVSGRREPAAGEAAAPVRRPASRDEPGRGDAERGRAPELVAPAGDEPGRVRGDRGRGEPSAPRGDREPVLGRDEAGVDRDAGATDQPAPPRQRQPRLEAEPGTGQTAYAPSSKVPSLDTLVPVNMAAATSSALDRIEARHGAIDGFVAERLGYSNNELPARFSAEQIDAIAAAIDNVEKGAGFIIGDATGVGKGRVVAAMLRYAMRHDMVPVFVTEKPDLYGDMFRDMTDIGLAEMLGHEPRMFMTNTNEAVPLDDEALAWKAEKDAARASGAPTPKRRGRFLLPLGKAGQERAMRDIAAGEGKFDVVFTTYDQMNTIKRQETDRRRFLDALAPQAFLVLDEAHNAGGAGPKARIKAGAAPDRAAFVRGLAGKAKAVMYSSATYAKRPEVMDLYARTDMGKAVDDPKALPDLIQKGGVPMQQVVATMLSRAGQYIRRERSFSGVSYEVEAVPVDTGTYRNFSEAVRAVFRFDLAVKKTRDDYMKLALDRLGKAQVKDAGVGEAAAHSTAFASIMHNVVNQMLLAIKAGQVAERAIKAHKAGEKPVIGLANTMESFISDFADAEGITGGQDIDITFGDVLARYLARTLRVTVKGADGRVEHLAIPVSDLPIDLQRQYREALDVIAEGDYAELLVSPIDWMRHKLSQAGLKVAEVTGRGTMIDYSEAPPKYAVRPRREMGPAGKRASIAAFNRGDLDALILNRSGSTGVSMHASRDFKDQRRRRMILAQAEPNIDTHLQMLGRVHRTGQVVPPAYSQMAAEIPAEARPTAVLMKKMASLNANTTASRKSVFMAEAVDFINAYGDIIVAEILAEEPDLDARLGGALKFDKDTGQPIPDDAARRATVRLVLLDPEEQAEFLDRIQEAYKAEIARLDAMGENTLEAQTVDLQAKVIEATPLKDRLGEGPFLDGAWMTKVSAKAQGRAMTAGEIVGGVAKGLGIEKPSGDAAQNLSAMEATGRAWAAKKRSDVTQRAETWAADEVRTKSQDARDSTRRRLENNLLRWQATAEIAFPGARVALGLSSGDLVGVVTSLERKARAKNPAALSAWEVTIAVPDSARQFVFPMSKLFPPSLPKGEDEQGASLSPSRASHEALLRQFDEARREGRETRYIVTGNILAGYDQVEGRGRIVNYTTDDGQLRPGILMGREFSLERFLESRSVRLRSGAQVERFLSRVPDAEVKATDGYATLRFQRGRWVIETPAGRATGGRYYTDPAVRQAIAPAEFVRSGGVMRAELEREPFIAAVDAMRQAGALFETREAQDIASQIAREAAAAEFAEITNELTAKPEEQAKPAAAPSLDQRIAEAAYAAAGNRWRTRVYLSDLRDRLADVPRQDLDAALLRMQRERKLVLYPLDNPLDRTPARMEAAVTVGGDQMPIAYVEQPEPETLASLVPQAAPPRAQGIPKEADPPLTSYPDDATIKAHPDYRAAKAGDIAAAVRMVPDVAKPETVEEAKRRFGPEAIYVPVVAEEAIGKNAIPRAVAEYYAAVTGAQAAQGIAQATRAFHTGARPLERLIARPLFAGPVEPGRRYVLVDDVSVMGGTLAELANHIRAGGGEIAGVVTLVNASRSGLYNPRVNHVRQIEARFGDIVRQEFGIEPQALTADEAVYVLGFRNADGLRASIATTRRQRDERLRAKGLRPPETEGLGQTQPNTFAAEFLQELAAVDDLFAYPISKAGNLRRVFRDIDPSVTFVGDASRPDEANDSGADKRFLLRTQKRDDFFVYQTDEKVWIDVSRLQEGGGGSAIYAAVGDYAFNTKRVFIGDPAGLSDIALRRRAENMLSQALKHGTTEHLAPHPNQLKGNESLGVPPLRWREGDHYGNVQSLIEVNVAALKAAYPEIERARYDFSTHQFVGGRGMPILEPDFERAVEDFPGRARPAAAGSRTLKRGILLNTLLRAESGQRPGLLEQALRLSNQLVRGTPLERTFYSTRPPEIGDRSQVARDPKRQAAPQSAAFSRPRLKIEGEEQAKLFKAISDAVNIVNRIAGPRVAVEFYDQIPREQALTGEAARKMEQYEAETGTQLARTAGGFYQRSRSIWADAIIGLATKDPIYDLRTNAGHEAWHHVELELASDAELRLLRSEPEQARLRRYAAPVLGVAEDDPLLLKQPHYEITALAFERWRREREEGDVTFRDSAVGRGLHIGIRRFFERVNRIFRNVVNALRGLGYGSFEDIFERARAGEFASRKARGNALLGVVASFDRARPMEMEREADETLGNVIPTGGLQAGSTPPGGAGAILSRRLRRTLARFTPALDYARVKAQDRALPIRRIQEEIERGTGERLPINLDTYVAESLYYGRAGERLTDLQDRVIEPLIEHLRRADISLDALGEYLYARHASERNEAIAAIDPDNESGSGMSEEDAAEVLSRVQRSGKQAEFDAAAAMIDDMIQDTRRGLRAAGLIDDETFEQWGAKYQHYVPLRGFEVSEEANQEGPRSGRGFDVRGPESRQALGRRTKADNPVAYAVLQAQQAIIRAEKNRVGKTLLRVVQAHPNDDVWKVFRGKAKRRLNPTTGLVETYWVPPAFVHADNLFAVKVGGKTTWLELKHQGLARAMRGVGSEVQGTILGRVMMGIARRYAALLTSYNPEFVLSNFFRDVETALINVSDVAERPEGVRRQIIKDALSAKAIRGILSALRGSGEHEYAPWFDEYRRAGGKISFMEYNDIDRIRKRINKSLRESDMRRALRGAAELVEDLNTSVENGVRLSTYIALRRGGVSQDRAAFIARELTVNFNRKGELGPGLNALYIFFNASAQGTIRIAQAVTRSKAVRFAVGGIFATGIALDLMNALLAGDDDDGENAYDKIPEWVKERNLIIMIPGDPEHGYVQIPLAYGYNVPYLAGQQLMSVLRGAQKPLEAAATIGGAAAESFNPIGSAVSLAQFMSPTLLDPYIQTRENKTWYGGPIYPQKFDKRVPDSETYFSSAPWWAVETARLLNQGSGGNIGRPGLIDVSPETLEHYLEFAAGGIGKFVMNAYATGERLVTGDDWLPEKTPFVRRLYSKTTTVSRRREFYEAWDQVDAARFEVTELKKTGLIDEARAARRRNEAEIRAYGAMKGAHKALREFRKQRDAIEASRSLNGGEKRRRVDEIMKRENAVILRALGQYNKVLKESRQKKGEN